MKDEFKEEGLRTCLWACVLEVGGNNKPGDPEEGERHNSMEGW